MNPSLVVSFRIVPARLLALAIGLASLAAPLSIARSQPGVPDPAHSTVPAFIRLGGAQTAAGTPDPTIAFTVTYRDFLNNPVPSASIVVDFTNCSDVVLCTAVVAGHEVDCATPAVRAVTDVNGQARMSILGAGSNPGTSVPPAIEPGSGSGCIRVFANGIQLATATAVVYDPNGALATGNGVNGLDFAVAKNDVGASGLGAPYRGRTDYTTDGAVNGADLSALKHVVGASGLGQGSGAGCSGGGDVASYCP